MSKFSNKLILRNTIYLYVRMIFSMVVSLYTSRIILQVLGVSDYGIYNVVGGIVVLIALLNNSMSAATQRFITFELGRGDLRKVSDTFSMSMTVHIAICAVVLLLGETIGLYYVTNYLNVPDDRQSAALWVYQMSLLAVLANIVRIPYHASVIAYEKMNFFAVISIFEVVMKLAIVFALLLVNGDKLVIYAILVLVVTIVSTLAYKSYCVRSFTTCSYYWTTDRKYLNDLLGFFGWNFMGTMATAGTNQIGNLIVNAFCGTIANAAYGVANQVNAALNSFSFNFQVAYTPQIVKLYSQEKREELFLLMNRTALLSYYLLFVIATPLYLHIDFVLETWLKDVPPYAGLFCQWLIIYNLIDAVQAPLWKVITATGKIRTYEIWLSAILALNIPLTYFGLKYGLPPYAVVVVSTGLNLLSAVIRTLHVKLQVGFPVAVYLREVILRTLLVSAICLGCWYLCRDCICIASLPTFILFFVLFCTFSMTIIYLIGVNKQDRRIIREYVFSKIKGHKII